MYSLPIQIQSPQLERVSSVLIPDGENEFALRVLRCLGEVPGLRISVLSRDKWAPTRFSRHTSRFLSHSIDEADRALMEVVRDVAQQVGADVILPTGFAGMRFVSRFRRDLAQVAHIPPLASAEDLDRFADKLLFAEILEREGIPYPKIVRLEARVSNTSQLSGIRFPALVKPRNREAGSGIRLCETAHQAVDYLANQGDHSDFFVQEFVQGFDIGCSVLCDQGQILAYTIQKGIAPAKKPFSPAAAIEFVQDKGVLESIARLVSSVRWSGVANFDLVFDWQTMEAKVLEANPRYWRSLHGSLQAGVSFPYLACLASCGIKFDCPEYRHVRYAGPASAMRLILQNRLENESLIAGFAESGMRYIVRDPCADLAIQLRKLGLKIQTTVSSSSRSFMEYLLLPLFR